MQGSKLYVGNLSYSATTEELEELFSNYGEVRQVNIIGDKGFGFDPIFQPKGKKTTFAEMSLKSKNLYSHRQKSLREMFTSLTAFENNK